MKPRSLRAAAALGAALFFTAASACTKESAPRPAPSTPATPTGSSTALAWRRIASAPIARQEVAVAVMEGEIYVVGGLLASGGATDAVEIYNPETNTWRSGPHLPIRVHHAMAVYRKGTIVVLGGFVGDLGGPATKKVFVLEGGRWREGPSLRRPRGAGAAVFALGRSIVVVGGISNGRHVAPVEILEDVGNQGWRDGAPIPSLRDHLAAAEYGGRVFVSGGRRGGGHFATFEIYDVENDRWTSGPPMPNARSGHGAATIGTLIMTAGGEGPRIFPEVEGYDIETNEWMSYPPMGVPRHGVGVAPIGFTLYTLVGGVEVGLAPSAASEVLDLG